MKSIPFPLLMIIWLLFSWLILWITEILTEPASNNRVTSDFDTKKKKKMKIFSMFGLFRVGILMLTLLFLSAYFATPSRHGPSHSIELYLKQWGVVFKLYVEDNVAEKGYGSLSERFPPLAPNSDLWVPDLNVLYPGYSIQPQDLTDSGNYYLGNRIYDVMEQDPPDLDEAMRLMAQTYVYPGWAVQKTFEVDFIKQLRKENVYEEDFRGDNVYLGWMREGVERFYITDINNPAACATVQSSIPVMITRPRYERYDFYKNFTWWRYYLNIHLPDKPRRIVIPVLFLDGHVEMMPQDEAPDYIKVLVEFLPEPTLTSQEFSALMDRRLENEINSAE